MVWSGARIPTRSIIRFGAAKYRLIVSCRRCMGCEINSGRRLAWRMIFHENTLLEQTDGVFRGLLYCTVLCVVLCSAWLWSCCLRILHTCRGARNAGVRVRARREIDTLKRSTILAQRQSPVSFCCAAAWFSVQRHHSCVVVALFNVPNAVPLYGTV